MNWLPPASTDMPSPAMTVLKGALQKAGFNCKILYWNILFEDIIRFYLRESSMDKISEVDYLGVFYAYIAIEKNDKDALLKQEIILKSLNPHYFSSSFDFSMKEIKKISVQELDILAQEAASLKGGQTVKPFTNDVQTNKHSIVAPAPYKGEPGVHGSFYI